MKYVMLAVAVVVTGLFALGLMTNSSQTAASTYEQHLNEEKNAQKPNEIQLRTGIPELTSFETEYSDAIKYFAVKEGQYNYLDRAIKQGATIISIVEMDEYFKTFSDYGYRFAMTFATGETKYYTINYFEPPISLGNHNVYISIKDHVNPSGNSLQQADATYLSQAMDRPFRWNQVDGASALTLVKRIAADGNEFNASTKEGYKTIRVMYIGPLSEELKFPEFQAMYGQTIASQGGQ
ncbi:MAG: hypothetical protein ABI347_02175 [Nitrososphaera sp.]|jgi:hypothetical protein